MALNGTNEWAKLNGGYIDDISPEQQQELARFRDEFSTSDLDVVRMKHETYDTLCLRYLRARKFDHEAATTMLRESIAWRRETRPDKLRGQSCRDVAGCSLDEMRAFYPFAMGGTFDDLGHPLYAERTGRVDVDAMLIVTDHDRLVQNHIRMMEQEQVNAFAEGTRVRERPFPVDQLVAVMDLNGLSTSQISSTVINYVRAVSGIDQLRYPEQMYKTFIINAPGIFSMAWSVIKKFLDERTRQKIQIISGPGTEQLLQVFTPEQLPVELGGKLVIPGGFFKPTRTKTLKVNRGKVVTETFRTDAGTAPVDIKWFSRGGELKYSISFQADGASSPQDVVPLRKATDRTVMQDRHVPPGNGTYTVTLSNAAGWTQRTVCFRFDIEGVHDVEERKAKEANTGAEAATETTAGAAAKAGAGTGAGAGAGAGAAAAAPATGDVAATAPAPQAAVPPAAPTPPASSTSAGAAPATATAVAPPAVPPAATTAAAAPAPPQVPAASPAKAVDAAPKAAAAADGDAGAAVTAEADAGADATATPAADNGDGDASEATPTTAAVAL